MLPVPLVDRNIFPFGASGLGKRDFEDAVLESRFGRIRIDFGGQPYRAGESARTDLASLIIAFFFRCRLLALGNLRCEPCPIARRRERTARLSAGLSGKL